MRRRRSAAAAQNAHAHRRGFAREQRKIFRRRLGINDAIAFALGKAGIGHAADAHVRDTGQFLQDGQKRLRAESAIGADYLDVFIFQLRGGVGGTQIAESGAFLGISELRDDRQTGKRAYGVDGDEQLFDVGKSFQNVEIDAALFQRQGLFVENFLNLFGLGMAGLHAQAERAHGAGDQHFAAGGVAGFAGDFYAAAVEALHFIAEAERRELETVGAESIGLDDLRAGLDVGLVHAKNGFGLGGIQLVKTALRAHGFVQQGAHRAVGDENGVFQTIVEILDLQFIFPGYLFAAAKIALNVFVP